MFPEYLDDFVTEDNAVRVIEAFVAALDLRTLGFEGVDPYATGRPAYHPAVLLKRNRSFRTGLPRRLTTS